MAMVLMTAVKLHKFVENLMIRVSVRELSIFKEARKCSYKVVQMVSFTNVLAVNAEIYV